MGDPALDGGFTFIEVFGDFSQACSGSIGGDHLSAFVGDGGAVFCVSLGKCGLRKGCQKSLLQKV